MNMNVNLVGSNFEIISEDIVGERNIVKFRFADLPNGFGPSFAAFIRRSFFILNKDVRIFSFAVEGLNHFYDLLPYVKEDTSDIVINLRGVVLKLNSQIDHTIVNISLKGPCIFRAGMIENSDVEIINKDLVIMSVNEKYEVNIKLKIGRGLISEEDNSPASLSSSYSDINKSLNWIKVDYLLFFSPIESVEYKVQSSLKDGMMFDNVDLIVKSRLSFSPVDILKSILKNFVDYFGFLIESMHNLTKDCYDVNVRKFVTTSSGGNANSKSYSDFPLKNTINPDFLIKVADLELSIRSLNCLKTDNIMYIGDLVQRKESDMLRAPNFGRKSLLEIIEVLHSMGLGFGMKIDNWDSIIKDYHNNNEE